MHELTGRPLNTKFGKRDIERPQNHFNTKEHGELKEDKPQTAKNILTKLQDDIGEVKHTRNGQQIMRFRKNAEYQINLELGLLGLKRQELDYLIER